MSKWLAVAAVITLASGCNFGSNKAFTCDPSSPTQQCNGGPGGMCEPLGFCSFSDPTCPSGRRYGDLSGAQSGVCVGQEHKEIDASVPPPKDAAIDSAIDAPPPDAQACFGTGIVKVCFASAPDQPKTFSADQTLDTDAAGVCATNVISGGTGYCVIGATTISVTAVLRATGSRPLVLIASDSISVSGVGLIDASSRRLRSPPSAPETGAGADPALCIPGTPATNGGGGAGGSFDGSGGTGGTGNGANASTVAVPATPPILILRGGCAGQDGQKTAPGSAGHGGGAVYLIAGTRIDIGGKGITAGGEAGGGGVGGGQNGDGGGGGGGGAGGMLGFDAPTIAATAPVVANGGAGGEGGRADSNVAGNDGADAGTTLGPARGGNGATATGGDGGNGSAGAARGPGANGSNGVSTGGGTPNFGGGGGGGGGAGLIKAPATASFANMVSPLPTP